MTLTKRGRQISLKFLSFLLRGLGLAWPGWAWPCLAWPRLAWLRLAGLWFHSNMLKNICIAVISFPLVGKACVLICSRSNMSTNWLFYCVSDQICKTIIWFTVLSFKHIDRPCVLLSVRATLLKNTLFWRVSLNNVANMLFYYVFARTYWKAMFLWCYQLTDSGFL